MNYLRFGIILSSSLLLVIPPTSESYGNDPVVSYKEHEMETDFMNDDGVVQTQQQQQQ